MIETRFRRWIILWMIIATCYIVRSDIHCPMQRNCSCHPNHNGEIEIHCPSEFNPSFVVNVQPLEYIQIQCYSTPQWTEFHLSNLLPSSSIESMYFKMCNLPTNTTLGDITKRLGAENVKKLIFQSFGNLSTTLTRKHLQSFPELQRLTLSSNGLTNLSSDVFEDVPHLVWLDLRENNVHLPSGIFKNTPNLTVLELGNNLMLNLEPNLFDPLKNLRFLNLWKNKFTKLEPGTFDELTSLNSLDLNSNELTTLPRDIFAKLENLEALSLFWNNFSSLPEGLLQHNVNLVKVNLHGNRRNMTTLPRGLFANLTKLTQVQLRSNGLIRLPEDLFHGSVSLRNISLERNYLEALPEGLFKGLSNVSILKLGLNELTSLPNRIFEDLKKMIRLDLSNNHLTSISRHLFSGTRSLEVLNMERNQLKIIEDTSFNSLINLRTAIFSDNHLTFSTSLLFYKDEYGRRSPFHGCTSLEELYLAKNNISEIFSDWIISTLKLRRLDLKYNQLQNISAVDLQFLSNNIEVDLRHNQIQHIYMDDAQEVAKYQEVYRDVKILIENNPIVCDCYIYDFLRYLEGRMHPNVQNYFQVLPGGLTCQKPEWLSDIAVVNLNSKTFKCEVPTNCPEKCTCWKKPNSKSLMIDCSNRNLTSVPQNIKISQHYKFELDFTGNKLTRMSPLTEIGLNITQISKLMLSNNNINDISVDELPPNLEVLELHNNNISKLNADVLEFMNSSHLITLTLHGNPWTCDCDARDFLNFIQTKVVEIPDSLQITCKGMNDPMLKMIATDLCPMNTVVIVGLSMTIAITGLIIGLLAALYYRYQREIKVWLYAHQLCLWLVTENELDKDKLYDAFISYSHKDEDFVVNELVPKLESGPRPFKLCLHFRDWLVGEWIPAQIARSVEDSRRTVVVLSPNFLESVWGRMEFRTAHSQALSEGRARVILILYGEIGPTEDLDPELKAYLSTNTYVKWGDPWFWDKLRYALPHPPELTKNSIRRKIFEKHQPCIQINGEKKELIYPVSTPETPLAASTPPADTLKTFICDEKNGIEIKNSENLSPVDSNAKLILSSEEFIKHNFMNKVQCTTV